MLDLHCHPLVAVDDGPPTPDAALRLLTVQRDQGVRELVATPHRLSPRFLGVDDARIATAWPILQQQAADLGLTVHLGGENHLSGQIPPDVFAERAVPLGPSRAVLVELPDDHLPLRTWEACFALQRRGLRPVIAHPERCKGLDLGHGPLVDFLASGGLLQLTAGHLAGVHGWRMRWRSRRLLGRYPTSCVIASDGHDDRARRPAFDRLPTAYRAWCCPSLAALATWAGPRSV